VNEDRGGEENVSDTESEPSSSQQSQVGKDFEIVDKEEAEDEKKQLSPAS
jgi:hypothetical protein